MAADGLNQASDVPIGLIGAVIYGRPLSCKACLLVPRLPSAFSILSEDVPRGGPPVGADQLPMTIGETMRTGETSTTRYRSSSDIAGR